MTVSHVTFTAPDSRATREALRQVAERFRTRGDGRSATRRTYYDTFDWRIHHDGGTLAVESSNGPRVLAWRRRDDVVRYQLHNGLVPEFSSDLERLPSGDELARIIDVRRLLPLVEVEIERETLAVLDGREKTVARVHVERGRVSGGDGSAVVRPMAERLLVSPVLGFDDAHEDVVRYVEKTLKLPRQDGCVLTAALAAVDRCAGDYSSKLDVPLEPTMRTEAAVRSILGHLLKTMKANEDGTRRDIDSEFLHDFRVSVRRTRSCLGQLKGVFEPDDLERFRSEFEWLGTATGPTRDLDVYLLNLGAYRLDLPASLRPGLDDLESHLRRRQKHEQGAVARALASKRYAKLLRDWPKFLDRPQTDGETRPNAGRPVRDVAAERIRAAFDRVRKRGRHLDDDTPAATVHQVRIDCKKLRYLLEFFRSLLERERATAFVNTLKRLQDHLGEFNDLDVQQCELRESATQMLADGRATTDTLLAMGCLVGRLERRQVALRRRLVPKVRSFVSDSSRKKLQELVQ